MTIIFNTRPFFRSHFKEPRGYGSWAFEFCDSNDHSPWFTRAQAKKAARAVDRGERQ